VLVRVWTDGAYAAPALDGELKRAGGISPRDASLATELVYGVLRCAPVLEQTIATHARSSRWSRKPWVRAHLLMAAYTIVFLDRVPSFAAVSEAVTAIKHATGDGRLAGFANAVLRKVAHAHEEQQDLGDRDQRLAEAVVKATPSWLRHALEGSLGGRDEARQYVTAVPLPPPVCLCLRHDQPRPEWVQRLQEAAPKAEISPGKLSPRCIATRRAGDPRKLPGFGDAWVAQEEGAQAIALTVGAKSGEWVLDACAGRGGKTLMLAEAVGPSGVVDAADLHATKLQRLPLATGPKSPIRKTIAVDWTCGSGDVTDRYDRVLVDAPCTGVGTLRRRPEIVQRLAAHDVTRLAALQLAILRGAAHHVRDGGRLVYAVCSVLREECEGVVEALIASGPSQSQDPRPVLQSAPFDSELGQALAEGAAQFRILPHVHGTDGYFAASFIVRRP